MIKAATGRLTVFAAARAAHHAAAFLKDGVL